MHQHCCEQYAGFILGRSVLQAENKVLQAQAEQKKKTAKKVNPKVTAGDHMVLSKECMISQEQAEKELVAKEPAIARC